MQVAGFWSIKFMF